MDEKLGPPAPQEKEQQLHKERISRRTFLMNVGIALNALAGLVIAVPAVAFMFGPIIRRKEYLQWIAIGNVSEFTPGETRLIAFRNPFSDPWDGETANVPAYVRCVEPGKFIVFAINCAHLNCPVRWFAESQLFMCPCHGGVYYADGSRASGPPERGLFKYEVKVEGDKLMIRAGQMPTLQNRAGNKSCPGATNSSSPAIVARIEPCPNTSEPGTDASTTG
jgi:Rieske Fe-S protein